MPMIASIADIEAMESVPLSERRLPDSTYEAVKQAAEAHPEKTALSFFLRAADYADPFTWRYDEFLAAIHQTANMLAELGVGPDDTVTSILPNLPESYFTLLGGEAAGIVNPINPLLEPHVIAEIMNAAKTKVLVTLGPFPKVDMWERIAPVLDDVPTLETVLQVDLGAYLSGWKKWLVKGIGLTKPKVEVRARVLDFRKTMAKQADDRLVSGRVIQRDDIASYFHTGGTTGIPKLAQHTHFNEVYDGWAAGEVIDAQPGQTVYLGLPLFHNFGAIAIGINSFIHAAHVVIGTPQGFRGEGVFDHFWKILEHYKADCFGAVPTVYQALASRPNDGVDLSSLKVANSGAAPLPVEVANRFTEKSGVPILEGYGLTEATSVCSVNPLEGESRIGSVGLRLPYQEMRTAVVSGGKIERFCEVDEVGVVVIRGPNVFPGYKEDIHNQGVFVDAGDGRGPWLDTGDMGRMDADSYFWLTGRKKELIIRGGHNIDPGQIEEPLTTHPAVSMAAAVGRPDPRVGEVPVAYVELLPGKSATESEILAFAEKHIGERAAIPKAIYILDALPQTAVGKLFKPELVRAQVKEVFDQELSRLEGIATASVVAEGDKRLGTVARIRVQVAADADRDAVEESVRSVLGQYSVHHDITVI